jgi:hypothetical protein
MSKPRSAFYEHLKAKGRMGRKNPELLRLSSATGFSVEHVFKVATGQREGSLPFAKAIIREARNKAITLASFSEPQQ